MLASLRTARQETTFTRLTGIVFLFDVTSANYISQSKDNMKAKGVAWIFVLWLILMYIRAYSNYQVHSDLVMISHKRTSSKTGKNKRTGAGFLVTIFRALKWCLGSPCPVFHLYCQY